MSSSLIRPVITFQTSFNTTSSSHKSSTMPCSNGCRAQQKRERNAKKAAAGVGKSQLKQNEASKTVVCKICRQSFMNTVKKPELELHQQNKHSKLTFDACFPDVPQ